MLKGYFETWCVCLHYQISLVEWRRHFKLPFNYFIATSISLGNNSGFEFFTSENWLIQKLESNFSHAGKVQTFSLLYKSYIVLYPHVLQLHIHVCLNQGQLWVKESIWRLFHKNFELCLWKKKRLVHWFCPLYKKIRKSPAKYQRRWWCKWYSMKKKFAPSKDRGSRGVCLEWDTRDLATRAHHSSSTGSGWSGCWWELWR